MFGSLEVVHFKYFVIHHRAVGLPAAAPCPQRRGGGD